ncbi:hypothetical protein WKW79_27550 [Variovorax robiniae]|uniref:Pilus assembly protein PilX n=1 Tax=Variovorax robiniae TaxID=1836199 RepID=A0ABU8XH42_9BURK
MRQPSSLRRARGATLIFALLTLVVLGLATLALVRSVDTSALMLGNATFKQDATVSSDQAVRAAFVWLKNQTATTLGADVTGQGYYASTRDLDPTKPVDTTGQQYPSNALRQLIDWDGDTCGYVSTNKSTCALVSKDAGSTPNSNSKLRYVIFRLCGLTDAAAAASGIANNCATPSGTAGGGHEAGERGPKLIAGGAYYRVVVRVRGSRNSVSFIETIVQL